MSIKRIVGQKIRKLREERGWSQEELGRKIGLTKQQIYRIEIGETGTPLAKIEEFAELFDVPYDYFFEEEPPKNGQSRAWMDKLSPHLREALEKDIDKFLPYFRIVEKATLNDLSPMTLDAIVEAFLQAREIDEEAKRQRQKREQEGEGGS